MDVLVLHILKLNIIAAVVILLVKVLATLFKGRDVMPRSSIPWSA